MRWGVEQRLEFIDFRLLWEGGINRADIMAAFGVSVPQASKDLSLYEEKAPGNLQYDKREKRYFPSAAFRPRFLKPEADRYLAQLRSVSDDVVSVNETWLSDMPEADSMPIPHRSVDADVLRALLRSIRQQHSIEVCYQSMNAERPEPTWRRMSPHAFGHDGLRWHVRAFCHIDEKFKDFILSRCLDTSNEGKPGASPDNDIFWQEIFEVVLSPNPKLSKSQRDVIAKDYNMDGHRVVVPIRKALLYYFQKRLRLDGISALDGPHETPVIIENQEAFARALAEATS
ncbi:MAG TPA: WYL domain-containing protein [Beijerinckiaceae bacterium]|jgi:predicted DNA-binding transcriptional regulator YafY|nr:WYL domain-containing protein [Beijerinckiaceae bacterium]